MTIGITAVLCHWAGGPTRPPDCGGGGSLMSASHTSIHGSRAGLSLLGVAALERALIFRLDSCEQPPEVAHVAVARDRHVGQLAPPLGDRVSPLPEHEPTEPE